MKNNIFSKITAIVLAVAVLFSLTGCSRSQKEEKSVLTVNNQTEIPSGIFTYFLNMEYYSNTGLSDSDYIDRATNDSLKYLAVNSKAAEKNMTLSQSEKYKVSAETNALWRYYGKYLENIGVTKDDYFKIRQYETMREKIRFALFDKGGSEAINENYVKEYFKENYCAVKYFYRELYDLSTQAQIDNMTDEAKKAYEQRKKDAEKQYKSISNLATYVNSGIYTVDEAYMAVTGNVDKGVKVNTTIISKNDADFPAELVAAVFKQAQGSAFIITNSEKSYIYFIYKIGLFDEGNSYYDKYRKECLIGVSENYLENDISSWTKSFDAVRHTNVCSDCLNNVKGVDRSLFVGTDRYTFSPIEIK
jgi:hypothetical protein